LSPDTEITSRTVNTAPTYLTRQALRSEAAAREHAERSLADAQVSIRDLQTKLAHERRTKDEVLKTVERLETETQAAAQALETAEAELMAERLGRRNAENALAEALDTRQEAEEQLRDAMAVREARMPPQTDRGLADSLTIRRRAPAAQDADAEQIAGVAISSKTQARRRGRPAKVGNQDSEVVEWWKPGWQDKFR
jgi:chromosome segregation ATPase